MFRAVGAHYLDHFTLVLLHGLCLNSRDPQCKVGNLYPVSCIKKMSFKGIRPKKEGEVEDFSEGLGRFCRAEFPETYKSWEEAVREDSKVKNLMSHSGKLIIDPKFERDAPLTVAYSRSAHTEKLSGSVPFGATFARTEKGFAKYQVNAVNANGCLLSMIKKGGRQNNVGVVLIIKDVCGGSLLPQQPSGINAIVAHFTRAVAVAGLPKGEVLFCGINLNVHVPTFSSELFCVLMKQERNGLSSSSSSLSCSQTSTLLSTVAARTLRFVDGLIDNDEKVACCKAHTQFKTIGQKHTLFKMKMPKINTLFTTKLAEKPHPLWPHSSPLIE